MRIIAQDGKRIVDIGESDIWTCIYSTAVDSFGFGKRKISKALAFMECGECSHIDGYETARQFNLIRDEFAKISPEKAVYNLKDRKKKAPWEGKISPVVTSCANLFTTSDGKDLLYEVVSILTYAQIAKTDIGIE
ncbi:Imm70 family immunity protein [Bacillota bacterium LCP21S3_D9]